MIQPTLIARIAKLSVEERLELLGVIVDSIAGPLELSPAQQAELKRRLEEYGDSAEGIPWSEVEKELIERSKRRKSRSGAAAKGQKRLVRNGKR